MAAPSACGWMWDDVRADGDVRRHRHAQFVGFMQQREFAVRRFQFGQHLADRFADAAVFGSPAFDGLIQQPSGFFRHPERAGPERAVHVFRSPAGQRNLEIVDDAGTVCRQGGDEASPHQVNQNRSQSGFDDVAAEAPDDRAAFGFGFDDGGDDGAKVSAASRFGSESSSAVVVRACSSVSGFAKSRTITLLGLSYSE